MDGMEDTNIREGGLSAAWARAEQATARRLLACAGAAILLGAVSLVLAPPNMAPPHASTAGASADQGAGPKRQASTGPDRRASADIKPKLDDPDLDAAAQPLPPEAPLAPHETKTPGGLEVVAFFPAAPLTVRERARLRADASTDADIVESLEPGRPLRVVGAVDVPRSEGGPWLQVRLGNGEVAYVQAGLAADLAGWRRQQVAERLRRQEEEAAAAAAASGIDVQPGALPPDLMQGAPINVPFPDTQPFRPN